MPATHNLIQTYRPSSSQNTIVFSSIPQTYTDLKVIVSARSTQTGSPRRYISVNINGSSSNNTYIRAIAYSTSSWVSDYDPTNSNYGVMSAAAAEANTFGMGEFYFSNYANTTDNKAVSFTGGTVPEVNTDHMVGIWGAYRTTNSAITSITFAAESGGDFTSETVFSLYGIKNS
jgi:hypothetical protein